MSDSLFRCEGDRYLPQDLARGPWSPDALHGGPVAGLLAHVASGIETPGPMHPARLTIELLRPVPLAPLRATARVLRPGRKVQLVEAALFAGDTEVARCTLLRLREGMLDLPADTRGGDTAPPEGPSRLAVSRASWRGELRAYHSHATEHRVLRGSWEALGPCTDWIRLRVPLLPDRPLTPLERIATVSDFGNGISAALPYDRFTFINGDLTIHLHRLPAGEWVCLEASTWPESGGVGVAESVLYDERGRLGRALQSLLIEKR